MSAIEIREPGASAREPGAAPDPTGLAAAPGRIVGAAGAVVRVADFDPAIGEVVLVGPSRLMGEVIRLEDGIATLQVYEETAGLQIGDPVERTGRPLVAWLGPGLLGATLDGLGRPLDRLAAAGELRLTAGTPDAFAPDVPRTSTSPALAVHAGPPAGDRWYPASPGRRAEDAITTGSWSRRSRPPGACSADEAT